MYVCMYENESCLVSSLTQGELSDGDALAVGDGLDFIEQSQVGRQVVFLELGAGLRKGRGEGKECGMILHTARTGQGRAGSP